ncbi:hypothetical protein BSLG_006998 [Batrachochytrium salamandrivorans]|nr:hypothetical protein BSLG_006998 [Batrachochytrium salamandrivorans]
MAASTKVRWHLLYSSLATSSSHSTDWNGRSNQQSPTDVAGHSDAVFPSARHGHACQYMSYEHQNTGRIIHELVIFWGGNYGIKQDAFALDLDTGAWRTINAWKGKINDDNPQFNRSFSSVQATPSAACGSTSNKASGMYLFGGIQEDQDGDHITNRLFHYDARRDLFSTLSSTSKDDLPTPRFAASATYTPTGGCVSQEPCIFVFGGLGASHIPMSEFHAFDLSNRVWHKISPEGTPPTARESHTAIHSVTTPDTSGVIVVFGGFTGQKEDEFQRLNDIVYFNLDKNLWTRPVIHGFRPPGRSLHTSVLLHNKMVVFGGLEATENGSSSDINDSNNTAVLTSTIAGEGHLRWKCSNSVFFFDLEKEIWEYLTPEPALHDQTMPSAPPPRSGHTSVLVGNMMVITGGNLGYNSAVNSRQCSNDIWALEIGPPPPPGSIFVSPSATTVSALYSDNQADGMPAVQFTWDDEFSWFPNRTYRLEVQDLSSDLSNWRVLYEGVKRDFVAPLVVRDQEIRLTLDTYAASGNHALPLDELEDSHIYLVRVLCINFAGDSNMWPTGNGERIQKPLWIRNGHILEEADIVVPPLPTLFSAHWLAHEPDDICAFSWKTIANHSKLQKVRIQSRAIIGVRMERNCNSDQFPQPRHSQIFLKNNDALANFVDTEDTSVAHAEIELVGEWTHIWDGEELGAHISALALKKGVLIPALLFRFFDGDNLIHIFNGMYRVGSDVVDIETTSESFDRDEAPQTYLPRKKRCRESYASEFLEDLVARNITKVVYEFRICSAQQEKQSILVSAWTQPIAVNGQVDDKAVFKDALQHIPGGIMLPAYPVGVTTEHAPLCLPQTSLLANISEPLSIVSHAFPIKESLSLTLPEHEDSHLQELTPSTLTSLISDIAPYMGVAEQETNSCLEVVDVHKERDTLVMENSPTLTTKNILIVSNDLGVSHKSNLEDLGESLEDSINGAPGWCLPVIGTQSLEFQFKMRFGDRIEARWIKLRKCGSTSIVDVIDDAWYSARALYYLTTPNKASWRLKIHYEGFKKTDDQFLPLDGDVRLFLREPLGGAEIAPPGTGNEDGWFDLDSPKTYLLAKTQKAAAKRGECIVKQR